MFYLKEGNWQLATSLKGVPHVCDAEPFSVTYKVTLSPWEPSMSEEGWLWGFSLFNGWGRGMLEICRRKSAE